jgi:hypothetical protein
MLQADGTLNKVAVPSTLNQEFIRIRQVSYRIVIVPWVSAFALSAIRLERQRCNLFCYHTSKACHLLCFA